MQRELIRIRNFANNIIDRFKDTECILSDVGRKADIEDAQQILDILNPLILKCKDCIHFEVSCDCVHDCICNLQNQRILSSGLACENFKMKNIV